MESQEKLAGPPPHIATGDSSFSVQWASGQKHGSSGRFRPDWDSSTRSWLKSWAAFAIVPGFEQENSRRAASPSVRLPEGPRLQIPSLCHSVFRQHSALENWWERGKGCCDVKVGWGGKRLATSGVSPAAFVGRAQRKKNGEFEFKTSAAPGGPGPFTAGSAGLSCARLPQAKALA